MPLMIMKDFDLYSTWAYAVGHKGAKGEDTEWLVEQMHEDIRTVGVKAGRIVLKNDQEGPIKEVQAQLERRRAQADPENATAIDHSRIGDSNSNGRTERAVQEVVGVIRTLRSALEARVKHKVHLDHPVVCWMVRHAAQVLTRHQIRDTGRDSYQMIKWYNSIVPVAAFA